MKYDKPHKIDTVADVREAIILLQEADVLLNLCKTAAAGDKLFLARSKLDYAINELKPTGDICF